MDFLSWYHYLIMYCGGILLFWAIQVLWCDEGCVVNHAKAVALGLFWPIIVVALVVLLVLDMIVIPIKWLKHNTWLIKR